ncbi:MAG: hypothetical protein ABWW69_00825 [Pyrodictiaceae archaeon]
MLRGLSLEHVVILGFFFVTITAFAIVFLSFISLGYHHGSNKGSLEVSGVYGIFYDGLLYRIDIVLRRTGIREGSNSFVINISYGDKAYLFKVGANSCLRNGNMSIFGKLGLDQLVSTRISNIHGKLVDVIVYTDSLGYGHVVLGDINSPLVDFSGIGLCKATHSFSGRLPFSCLCWLLVQGDASDHINIGGVVFERGALFKVMGKPTVFVVVGEHDKLRVSVLLPGLKDVRGLRIGVAVNGTSTIIRIIGIASRIITGSGVLYYEREG